MPSSSETPSAEPVEAARPRGLKGRLFPGDPRVWRVAAVLGAVLAGVVVWQAALVEREYFTGTNSVVGRSMVVTPAVGDRLCQGQVDLPRDTGRIRFEVRPVRPGARLRLSLTANGRRSQASTPPLATKRQFVDIPVTAIGDEGATSNGKLCLRPVGGPVSFFGVTEVQSDAVPPTIDDYDVTRMLAIWYLPPAGSERTFIQSLPDIIDRAGAVFRPAPIGGWTYLLVLLLLPALGYTAVRLLATSASRARTRMPLALAIAAIGFLHALSWSVITPAFDAPDEMEHYAYAQSLAETGKAPCQTCLRQPRSTEELRAVDASGVLGYIESPSGRPPWLDVENSRFERTVRENRPAKDDGGGVTTAASHAPPYYGLLLPAYAVADALGGDVFSRLAAMRVISALLAALTAAFVFLTVRELLPGRNLAAAAAGLLVALHPMVNFIGGALNNDNGINATLALTALVLVRIVQKGLTPRRAAALGVLLVLAPLVKSTGYAAYPPTLLALAIVVARQHGRRDLPAWGVFVLTFLALSVLWSLLSPEFGRSVYATPDGGAPGSQPALAGTGRHPFAYLSYVWQVFLPQLPFMADLHVQAWPAYDIYVERGFAAFGWYAIKFPTWVYLIIVAGITAVVSLAVRALATHRQSARRLLPALAVLALLVATVIGGLHASFFSITGDRPVVSEQGRYAFTALAPLGVVAAAACYGLGRRHAPLVAAVLVTAMAGLAYASQLMALMSFYT